MFLAGVILGPKEPPLTTLNHYLTPLVNEFIDFWNPGVWFSRTFNRPEGRLVLAALVLVVCYLLAARKAAGFASCKHEHFCSVCHCTRSQHGYNNTNYHAWKRRTNAEHREAAQKYHDAISDKEQSSQFERTGLRWSELLRLPYFDIARCVIVDSMHNLFLGLIKEHFTGILGIGLPAYHETAVITLVLGPLPSDLSQNDAKGVRKLKAWLEAPASITFSPIREKALKKLAGVNLNALRFVCEQVNCTLPVKSKYTKADYVQSLLDWVSIES